MKKHPIFLVAITTIAVIIAFWLKDYKPDFRNNDQGLSYLWRNISNDNGDMSPSGLLNLHGEKKIEIGNDSTVLIIKDINYGPTWNRNRIYISLETKGEKISFTAEKAAGDLGWSKYCEDDDSRKLYLNSFSDQDVELLKIAYKAFKK